MRKVFLYILFSVVLCIICIQLCEASPLFHYPPISIDQSVSTPNCEYSVRADTLNGPIVRHVRVGDRLVHRWKCDNPNFGMLVKNCSVNDGYGSSVRVLDSRGCPLFTPFIQGPLQYDNSLNLAYVEVWAYKFPDRRDLFFQCQVQVCNKRENECVGMTPPNCPLIPKTSFTPSSVLVPLVGGGGVTLIRGTFPETGQLVVGYPYTEGYLYPGNIAVRPLEALGGAQAVLNKIMNGSALH